MKLLIIALIAFLSKRGITMPFFSMKLFKKKKKDQNDNNNQ